MSVELVGQLICASEDEAAAVRRHLQAHIALTRGEAGCIQFEVEPTDDPFVWTVFEQFVSQEAFDAHQARVQASDWSQVTAGISRDYVIRAVDDG